MGLVPAIDSYRKIIRADQLKRGMQLLLWTKGSQQLGAGVVTGVDDFEVSHIRALVTKYGVGLNCSDDQEILTRSGFQKAQDIKPGTLLNESEYCYAEVKSNKRVPRWRKGKFTMYAPHLNRGDAIIVKPDHWSDGWTIKVIIGK